jgi:serine/threonine protein kinase
MEDTAEAATLVPPADPEAETLAPGPVPVVPGDAVPECVGNYRLLRRLGGGGMGAVYEAEDGSSGRRVALKLIQPEYAASAEALERFRQEGELASKLSHPRCVFVFAADEDRGRPYIVMELMTGATLDDVVQEKGPLPLEPALRKILDVIDGLQEAHQLGLVHRDVKPSNCFLEADGRVKVGDFGLAKSLVGDARLTKTGTFVGTPLFAAPEQIKMEGVDA